MDRRMYPSRQARAGLVTTALAAIFLIGCQLGHPGSVRAEGPSRLYSHLPPTEHPDPIWVSATELLRSDGQLDWNVLGDRYAGSWQDSQSYLSRNLGQPEGVQEVDEEACSVTTVATWSSIPQSPPDDGLGALLRGATAAIAGRVTERTPGFLFGIPAMLLTVEVAESYRLNPTVQVHDSQLYIAYPIARFSVSGWVICGVHQKGPEAPAVGSRVVVLAQNSAADREAGLIQVSLEELIVETTEGSLLLPQNLKSDLVIEGQDDWETLTERLRHETELLQPAKQTPAESPEKDGAR